MLTPPFVLPAGISTWLERLATAGLLLLICNTWSVLAGDAGLTVANEPFCPLVDAGLSVIDAGCACGSTVSCDCAFTPFQLAVSVTDRKSTRLNSSHIPLS